MLDWAEWTTVAGAIFKAAQFAAYCRCCSRADQELALSLASPRVAPAHHSGGPPRRRVRLYPFLMPVGLFAVTRLFAGVLIVISSKHQVALGPDTIPGLFVFHPTPASPGYLAITSNWDGQWYESIATNGYHATAPGETATQAQIWAWAFPPIYPLAVGALMRATGLSFAVSSSVLNCAAGAAAMVLMYRVLERTGGRWLATSGVALSCCFISAPLLQAAYSESLALLFLLAAIGLIATRHYWLAILPVIALSFTRLITPVLCVVVIVSLVGRIRSDGWRSITRGEWCGAGVLAAYTVAGALVWPTLASHLMGETGRFNRSDQMANGWQLGWFGSAPTSTGWAGLMTVFALVAVPLLGAFSKRSKPWGLEFRTWSAIYPVYVFALTPITGGVLRYALLAPTLGLLLVGRPHERGPRAPQVALVVLGAAVGLAFQWVFVRNLMVIDSHPLMP